MESSLPPSDGDRRDSARRSAACATPHPDGSAYPAFGSSPGMGEDARARPASQGALAAVTRRSAMGDTPRQPTPAISVVIPAYNSGRFLDAAIGSVYNQTVLPAQVIVVNDGSTDDTEDRLRRLTSTLPPSFIWTSKPNGGAPSALNLGTSIATGDYIAFLDHDDTWHPNKLERQLQHFSSDSHLALSFTAYTYDFAGYRPPPGRTTVPASVIHHDSWDCDPEAVLELLVAGRPIVGTMSTVMVRRDALATLPPFDERVTIACDGLMYFELAIRRMKMDYLPESLVQYRWHGTNLSRDVGRLWEDVCLIEDKIWIEHADDLPDHLRAQARKWRAHWHLQTAIDAIRHEDAPRARRYILKAARIRPAAIRPGWLRMLGIGRPPSGPWPD